MSLSSGQGNQIKIDAAKDAALSFLESVQVGINPDIQVGLISFSDSVTVINTLTSDKNSLTNAINSLSANGNTAIGDAIQTAVERIRQERDPNASCFIVLMTDGMSNSDKIAQPSQAAQSAAQNNIVVDAVAFGSDADVNTCQSISGAGNGQYFYAATGNQLVSSFQKIASSIVSPALHYGSRIMMLIAIPLILFLPEIEKGTYTIVKTISTTVLKRPSSMQGPRCPNCERLNRSGSRFCGFCKAPLFQEGVRCSICGHISRPGAKFCGNCRAKLTAGVD
jgi:uncharacterized protein YegL